MDVRIEYSNARMSVEVALGLIKTAVNSLAHTENTFNEVQTLLVAAEHLEAVDYALAVEQVELTGDLEAVKANHAKIMRDAGDAAMQQSN